MDTTKQYFVMCEKGEEIQKIKPDSSDSSAQFFVCEICGNFYEEDQGYNWCTHHVDESENPAWLPRQDQLQDMLFSKYHNDLLTLSECFSNFVLDCVEKIKQDFFTSMEQLWLAFVMKEKYGKIWDGKEWIKA